MAGGKGSKPPSYNPAMYQQMMGYLQPTTSLPASMQVAAPAVMSPQQIMMQASGVDKMLPAFMQMNSSNPLFSSNSAQQAQQQYYNQAIAPQLQSAATQQFMGGNMGDSNSTFGSTMLGSMAAQGANQAFFSGQQYYDDQLNNLLNERSNYFGTSVQLPVTQNALGVQSQLGADQINAQQLGMLNNFNLGAAGQIGGLMQGQLGATTAYNQQKAQSQANLIGGGLGLLGGGIGLLGGGGLGSAIGSFSSGLGQGMFGSGSSGPPQYGNSGFTF